MDERLLCLCNDRREMLSVVTSLMVGTSLIQSGRVADGDRVLDVGCGKGRENRSLIWPCWTWISPHQHGRRVDAFSIHFGNT